MKAPATSNVNAPRLLATDPMGGSPALGALRSQQALSMAGALGPTVPAQRAGGLLEQGRQQQMAFDTQQLGANQAMGGMQAELAAAPQGDYLQKQPNMTAAAELMTPEQKAQALVDLHRQNIILAAEEATGQPAKLRQLA
jgi:hypothetical protein